MRPITPPPTGADFEGYTDWLAELYRVVKGYGLDALSQELTVSGAVSFPKQSVELSHATVVIAATIASTLNHPGLFIVKNTSASGATAHTLTLTSGTFDGTNTVATLNAPNEALMVYFDSAGDGSIIENINGVGLA